VRADLHRFRFAVVGGLLGTVTGFYLLAIAAGVGILSGLTPNASVSGAMTGAVYVVGFLAGVGTVRLGGPGGMAAHRRRRTTVVALLVGTLAVAPGRLFVANRLMVAVGWPHLALTVLVLLAAYALGYRRRVRERLPVV